MPKNCADQNACTTDGCNSSSGACTHDSVDCDDDDPCTADACDPQTGCTHNPVDCDDDDPCTTDGCNPSSGECTNDPVECDSENCEKCEGGECKGCDDDDPCTVDVCDVNTNCVYTPNPCAPGCSDPCCNPFDVCCPSYDRCCTSNHPCCGSPDPCCYSTNPCCGNPDRCCNSDNPCCGSTDPCCHSNDDCCDSSDRCCNSDNPCCGSTDPCCDSNDPCCENPEDRCCNDDNPCCGSEDPCCNSNDPCCETPEDRCCNPDNPCCGSTDPCCNDDNPCCGSEDPCCNPDNPDCDPACTPGDPDCCTVACCHSSDPCCNQPKPCGDDEDDPDDDEDNQDCDNGPWPPPPCLPGQCCPDTGGAGGGSAGGGGSCPDSGGDALHVEYTTGNVWTMVPILGSYANDGVDLELTLRYDSQRASLNGAVGYGWTHSYNANITTNGPNKVIFHTGDGRRNAFTYDNAQYIAPKGRAYELTRPGGFWRVSTPGGAVRDFNADDKLSEYTDAQGRITRFRYGGGGRLVEVVSPYGRKMAFSYDVAGRLTRITHPDGEATTLAYSAEGELESITDPLNHTVAYEYDDLHRLTRETLKNGEYYTAQYVANGAIETRRILDDTSAVVVEAVSTNGFPATRSEPMTSGVVTHTDGLGNAWLIRRDNLGRLRQITAPNEGPTRTFVFGGMQSGNARNRLTEVQDERGHSPTAEYDDYGNRTKITDAAGNLEQYVYGDPTIHSLVTMKIEPDEDVWEYKYDGLGNLTQIIDPIVDDGPGGSDATEAFTYTYYGVDEDTGTNGLDLPGRLKVKTHTDRNGNVTRYEYSGAGNLTRLTRDYGTGLDELNLVTEYEYDAAGRRTKETVTRDSATDVVTEYAYDAMGRRLTVTQDPGGLALTTTSVYDGQSNLTMVTNPRGYDTTYTYDHRNRRISQTVADGNLNLTTEWAYDGDGNMVQITDPNGNVTSNGYDARNFLVKTVDAEGYVTSLTLDGVGNVTRTDRGLSPGTGGPYSSVAMEYDALNRVTTRTVDPNGLALTSTYEYEPQAGGGGCGCGGATPGGAEARKIIDPKDKVTFRYFDALNRLVKAVRKMGDTLDNQGDNDDLVTTYEYDAQGNPTAVVGPMGERTEYEYDGTDRRIRTIRKSTSGDQTTQVGYDGAGNTVSTTTPEGNTQIREYDAVNRLAVDYDEIGTNGTYEYDANGNRTARTDGTGAAWRYVYDAADRLTEVYDPLVESPDQFTAYEYDAAGNRTLMTDNNGMHTRYTYDKRGSLTETVEDTTGLSTVTTRAYNGAGWLVSLKDDEDNETAYDYDGAGRVSTITYPDAGDIEFAYDAAGNVTTRTDQKGVVATYTYDDAHRKTGVSYSTGGSESFAYDKSGRMTGADNAVVQIDSAYDDLGRVTSETQHFVVTNDSYTVQYAYAITAGGRSRTITYPGGWRTVTESYDGRNRLYEVDSGEDWYRIRVEWSFDGANRRTAATLGNGVTSLFEYDVNGRMTHLRHRKDSTDLYEARYGYDATGNRLYARNEVHGDRSELNTYDARDRLRRYERGTLDEDNDAITELADPLLPGRHGWLTANWLDSRGNWLTHVTRLNGATLRESRTVNGVNEYPAIDPDDLNSPPDPVSLTHDANGNLTQNPLAPNAGGAGYNGQAYVYDGENRLVKVTRTTDSQTLLEILYDAKGRRVASVEYVNPTTGQAYSLPRATRHVYAESNAIEEYDVSTNGLGGHVNSGLREFVWGNRFPEPLGQFDWVARPPSGLKYHLRDDLGSVVGLANALGVLWERYVYDPYGAPYIEQPDGQGGWTFTDGQGRPFASSWLGNPFMFTGQRYDPVARLYHFKHRTLSPSLGRWLQRDPLATLQRAGSGYQDGMSLYQYARSNPVTHRDLFGMQATRPGPGTQPGTPPGTQPGTQPCLSECQRVVNDAWERDPWVQGLKKLMPKGCKLAPPTCTSENIGGKGDTSCPAKGEPTSRVETGHTELSLVETVRHELVHALSCCRSGGTGNCTPERATEEVQAVLISRECTPEGSGAENAKKSCRSCIVGNCMFSQRDCTVVDKYLGTTVEQRCDDAYEARGGDEANLCGN